jgi:hypothetical protein
VSQWGLIDAVRWRDQVDADLFSEEGMAAAPDQLHMFMLDAVGQIAGCLGRGDDLISQRGTIRQVINWQSHKPITARQARAVADWLEARGHIMRVTPT